MSATADRPDPAFAVRRLIRAAKKTALATLTAGDAGPFVSLATVAPDMDGSPLLLLSRLAEHSTNLAKDARAALLFDGTGGHANPQEGPRASVCGRLLAVADDALRRRFLMRHPGAALYAGFADFSLFRLEMTGAHWVGGFARARRIGASVALPTDVANGFRQAQGALTDLLNGEAPQIAIDLARRRRRMGEWRFSAIDPDGFDIAKGESWLRVDFPTPVADPDAVLPTVLRLTHGGD
jgi:putative heme iron utilization protein